MPMLDRCVRPSPRAEDENDPLFSAEVDFAPVFSYKRGVIKEILDQGHKQAQASGKNMSLFFRLFWGEELRSFFLIQMYIKTQKGCKKSFLCRKTSREILFASEHCSFIRTSTMSSHATKVSKVFALFPFNFLRYQVVLSHPVFETYLQVNSRKLSKWFHLSFFVYLIFVLVYTAYQVIFFLKKSKTDKERKKEILQNEHHQSTKIPWQY